MALRSLLRARGVAWSSATHSTPSPSVLSPSHGGRRGTKNLDWFYSAIAEQEAAKDIADAPPFPTEPVVAGRKRARAFLDFQFGKDAGDAAAPVGRVVVELADDIVPLTVENFLQVSHWCSQRGILGFGHKRAHGGSLTNSEPQTTLTDSSDCCTGTACARNAQHSVSCMSCCAAECLLVIARMLARNRCLSCRRSHDNQS